MTVSSILPVNNYAGNSSNTRFDFDFLIESSSELIVQHTNSDGLITILKSGVDYSINEIGRADGGYITFPLAGSNYAVLKEDERLSLMLSLVIKQEKEIRNSLFFDFNLLEWMFDYIIRILQILSRRIDRAVKVPEGGGMTEQELLDTLRFAQKEAMTYADAAAASASDAQGYADEAASYAQDAKFGMKWISFTVSNWHSDADKYKLILNDAEIINAVYKGSWTSKHRIVNIDIEMTSSGAVLYSPEAFDGYALSSACIFGTYTHTQTLAADEWVINHNLGCYPVITVTDENYAVLECTKIYNSLNKITLQFAQPVTGKVFLR